MSSDLALPTIAASVGDQFGVPVGTPQNGKWRWTIGQGNELTYDGLQLYLFNPDLVGSS
jgi:hypothetical protein